MLKLIFVALALEALASTDAAHAQGYTGNDLFEDCSDYSGPMAGYCFGYIVGASDGQMAGALTAIAPGNMDILRMAQETLGYCTPSAVTNQQKIEVVAKYLIDNPASRHRPAALLIREAHREAFPCS